MSRAEQAVMALYEDAGLRDELMDNDAERLYQWAEGQIARLDAQAADDETFAAGVEGVRGVLKGVNRFIGKRGRMTPEETTAVLSRIAASSAQMGRSVRMEDAALLAQTVPPAEETLRADQLRAAADLPLSALPLDDSAAVSALLSWLDRDISAQHDDPPVDL